MKTVKGTSPSQTSTQRHHITEESVLPLSGNCGWLDRRTLIRRPLFLHVDPDGQPGGLRREPKRFLQGSGHKAATSVLCV